MGRTEQRYRAYQCYWHHFVKLSKVCSQADGSAALC